jgi:ATP-binding cassette subfamily F protein 3
VAIVGVNGAGKTTLLKIMASEIAADEGQVRLGANVEIGYYAQHHTEQLDRQRTVLEEVWRVAPDRGESTIRGICGAFLFSGDDVEKAVGVLSGGERARVLLARLLVKPGNLLLMDEPTNHLDLASSEALAEALATFEGTLVFVSHNSSFVNRLANKVWDIVDGEGIEYPGNLRDYLERLDRLAGQGGAPAALEQRAVAPGPEPGSSPPARQESQRERKERKRREAEERNRLSRATQQVRQRLAELERRIGQLEREQAELEPQLADPQLYQDKQRFQRTLGRFEENRQKLEELYGRWEHQQQELERIERDGG